MNYPVGTVCIGHGFVTSLDRNRMECVILEGLAMRTGANRLGVVSTGMRYLVRWADGSVKQVAPMCLRRKEPPSGELSILRMFSAPIVQQRQPELAGP